MVAHSRFHRLAALYMALAATGVALCLSVAVAWHRVPVLWEQVLGAAVAVLVTLGVHLLPALANALIRTVRGGIQAAAWCLGVGLLWLVGMAWVLYGHATFMLEVQANAGLARVDAAAMMSEMSNSIPFPPSRGLAEIAQETTQLVTEQSKLATTPCETRCISLQAKRTTLAARLDALSVEAGEVRRWQAERERQEQRVAHERERSDAARDDAVMRAVAEWVGVPVATLNWIMALGLAIFFEGFAALCWTLALFQLEPRVPASVTPVEQAVTSEVRDGDDGYQARAPDVPAMDSDADSSYEARLCRARLAVQSGQLACTVRAVRRYLGCGSDTASAICKALSSA